MTTGNFWNTDDPAKLWGSFGPRSELVLPIGISDWLESLGTTYQSHEVVAESPLECLASPHADGVIAVRLRLVDGAPYVCGDRYPMRVELVGADSQRDDRTLWLQIEQR